MRRYTLYVQVAYIYIVKRVWISIFISRLKTSEQRKEFSALKISMPTSKARPSSYSWWSVCTIIQSTCFYLSIKSPTLLRESLSTIDTDNRNTDKLWEGKYIYDQACIYSEVGPIMTSCQPGFFVQISAALSILDRITHKSHVTSITIIPGFAIISLSNSIDS